MDVRGEYHADWAAFCADPRRAPDKTRLQLLREADASRFTVLREQDLLVWKDAAPRGGGHGHVAAMPMPPEAAALLYHVLCLELIVRCAGRSETRVHMRATLSFGACCAHIRELSRATALAPSQRPLACYIKSKYCKVLQVEQAPLFRTRMTTCCTDRVEAGPLISYQDDHMLYCRRSTWAPCPSPTRSPGG